MRVVTVGLVTRWESAGLQDARQMATPVIERQPATLTTKTSTNRYGEVPFVPVILLVCLRSPAPRFRLRFLIFHVSVLS